MGYDEAYIAAAEAAAETMHELLKNISLKLAAFCRTHATDLNSDEKLKLQTAQWPIGGTKEVPKCPASKHRAQYIVDPNKSLEGNLILAGEYKKLVSLAGYWDNAEKRANHHQIQLGGCKAVDVAAIRDRAKNLAGKKDEMTGTQGGGGPVQPTFAEQVANRSENLKKTRQIEKQTKEKQKTGEMFQVELRPARKIKDKK